MIQVTRVACSRDLNPGKYAQLIEQAVRLGRVRSAVWQRYGSVSGAQVGDRAVRDQWMADGTGASFGVLANPWKETVRDAVGDIRANREAAKATAREAVRRHTRDEQERHRLYGLLIVLLHGSCPPGLFVVPGPAVRMSVDTELIPDLVVIRQNQLAETRVTRAPVLAVEIQSTSTALFDLNTKKAVYERFSIESYWVVAPDVDQPELIAFQLHDGRYEQVAHVTGSKPFRATRPFDVEVVPAHLVAGLLPG